MRRLVLLMVALIALAMSARAEPGPIGQWLMRQPFTLWDIGMMRAGEAADEAADIANHLGITYGWVQYNWDNNEINIVVNIRPAVEIEQPPLTHDLCNDTRREVIGALSWAGMWDEEFTREEMHRRIGEWFSHYGFQEGDRDEQLPEKLARIIFVAVTMFGKNDSDGITCRDRIMTFDAPSKPIE